MGDKNLGQRENVDWDQVRVTRRQGKHGQGERKKKGKEAKKKNLTRRKRMGK